MANSDFDLEAANREAKIRLVSGLRGEGAHLSFEDAVADFPEELMNTMPNNVPYTFWHQIEHMRIAQWDLLKYITDPGHKSPSWPQEYWPQKHAQADREAWDGSIALFQSDRDELVRYIKDPSRNVLEPLAHTGGKSILRSALLVIDHNAYHIGEFVMGRQMLGAWKSALG